MGHIGYGQTRELIHITKTLQATAGVPWALGVAETLFTITGRVLVKYLSVFCTETLVGGTVEVGIASDPNLFIAQCAAGNLVAGDWWTSATSHPAGGAQVGANQLDILISEDIEQLTTAANTTDGTLVVDVWYIPASDSGALVAA